VRNSRAITCWHSPEICAAAQADQTYPDHDKIYFVHPVFHKIPVPRNPKLEILRFGAIDDEPDEGVVPESGVGVIYVKGARHIDLCDRGSSQIKDEIKKLIIQFLRIGKS
jgi:hypothetical protein